METYENKHLVWGKYYTYNTNIVRPRLEVPAELEELGMIDCDVEGDDLHVSLQHV